MSKACQCITELLPPTVSGIGNPINRKCRRPSLTECATPDRSSPMSSPCARNPPPSSPHVKGACQGSSTGADLARTQSAVSGSVYLPRTYSPHLVSRMLSPFFVLNPRTTWRVPVPSVPIRSATPQSTSRLAQTAKLSLDSENAIVCDTCEGKWGSSKGSPGQRSWSRDASISHWIALSACHAIRRPKSRGSSSDPRWRWAQALAVRQRSPFRQGRSSRPGPLWCWCGNVCDKPPVFDGKNFNGPEGYLSEATTYQSVAGGTGPAGCTSGESLISRAHLPVESSHSRSRRTRTPGRPSSARRARSSAAGGCLSRFTRQTCPS